MLKIGLLGLISLISCQVSSSEEENKPQNDTLPEDFIRFYENYHSDSVFQIEHTQFPLPYLGEKRSIDKWTKENWIRHKEVDIENSNIFERSFYRMDNNIIGEEIYSPSLKVKIDRRWMKTTNKWTLIYYKPID
jgi:hypothetical protein